MTSKTLDLTNIDLNTHLFTNAKTAWNYTMYRPLEVEINSIEIKDKALVINTKSNHNIRTYFFNDDVVSQLTPNRRVKLYVCMNIKRKQYWTALCDNIKKHD